jgi:hypothetical protein
MGSGVDFPGSKVAMLLISMTCLIKHKENFLPTNYNPCYCKNKSDLEILMDLKQVLSPPSICLAKALTDFIQEFIHHRLMFGENEHSSSKKLASLKGAPKYKLAVFSKTVITILVKFH